MARHSGGLDSCWVSHAAIVGGLGSAKAGSEKTSFPDWRRSEIAHGVVCSGSDSTVPARRLPGILGTSKGS